MQPCVLYTIRRSSSGRGAGMHRSIIVCIVYLCVRKENYVIILPYVSSLELCSVQTRDKGGDVKKLVIVAP